ncbi:MAG: type I-E CRISPR-associated protein Cas6/Cse3/CasE [Firmicutes bacterium]|jgi:CRISPR system Cascade subunit CasE|nr:type I-E CRISPR-associated protein Cas6/Cse3/CasE [Bacillota bacterium]
MYLSRIPLNVKRRDTMRALALPHIVHGAVESSFPLKLDENRERILWRVDYVRDTCYLLVLSAEQPEFLHISKQFGYEHLERKWETKNYNTLLARLQSGQVWRFRLRANPVQSSFKERNETSGRGKIFAHVTQQQQRRWLIDRAQACGFSLGENAFNVVHTEWKKFRKTKRSSHEVVLRLVDFEGILTITDAEIFKNTLLSGIGRAKAYGCGLLTVVRYAGDHDE